MNDTLKNLDGISFWLGFLAASLLGFLISRLRPFLRRVFENLKAKAQSNRQERSLNDAIRLGNDTMRLVQGLHLAAPLFSLDEILIPPRCLAPPVPPMAYEPPPSEDITDWSIPYMSDWPELASFYGAPTLSLAEALQGGTNLALTGQPGSGKSVALAHLAAQIIRKDPQAGETKNFIPLFIHAADLELPKINGESPLDTLIESVSRSVSSLSHSRLVKTLRSIFDQERALLLLDGLDELSPLLLELATGYLEALLNQYPGLRVVVAAESRNLGRLLSLGFIPIPLAYWKKEQRQTFITQWSTLWHQFVSGSKKETDSPEPLLLIGWLLNNTAHFSPLELTLKVWDAFAGDSLGPEPIHAIEAYLRRMTYGQSPKNRPGFEQLASQMVLAMQPIAERKSVERWLAGQVTAPVEPEPSFGSEESDTSDESDHYERVRARGALPDLIDSGLIIPRVGERMTIVHPVIAGYLASNILRTQHGETQLLSQPIWQGRSTTLQYISVQSQQANWIESLLENESADPTLGGLLMVSRWLRNAPGKLPWVMMVMRQLSEQLHNEQLPLALRGRILSALALSANTGVSLLMRQLLSSPHTILRQLAILGAGFLHDTKAVQEISNLINDPSPGISRAVILALVAIGDKAGMDTVAYALLHGDESLQRAAAEALANHPEEGYPTLEEGAAMDNPAVRRAAVFGLGRVKQPWATEILENLLTGDSQWVVQDAATQVLSAIKESHPRIPKPLPELTHTAWFIAFAGEHGMGVAPGKPAYDLLYQALKGGDEDQRLASLYFLSFKGDERSILPLYHTYFSSTMDVHEAAFNALWNLTTTGIKLPSPTQFGLK